MNVRTLVFAATVVLPLLAPEVAHAGPASAETAKSTKILEALELPRQAQALRDAGVDNKDVQAALKTAKKHKVAAGAAAALLKEAAKSAKDNGPVDNFGEFVKAQLDSGKRGKALAEAIQAEHRLRGKKKGKGKQGKAEQPRGDSMGARGKTGIPADKDKSQKPGQAEGRSESGGQGQHGKESRGEAKGQDKDRAKNNGKSDAGKPQKDKGPQGPKGKSGKSGKPSK